MRMVNFASASASIILALSLTPSASTSGDVDTIPSYTYDQKGQTIVGADTSEFFGVTGDMSADGDVVAAGAGALSGKGKVRIYKYDRFSEMWFQLGGDIDGQQDSQYFGWEYFGWALALAGSGERVAVASLAAAPVRVYEYDKKEKEWAQMGSILSLEGEGDIWGVAISHEGDRVAVGRPQGENGPGSTRVLEYDRHSKEWLPVGNDILGNADGDRSGTTLAMSESGRIVAVGSPQNDVLSQTNKTGYLSVYRYSWKARDWAPLGNPIEGLAPNEKVGLNVGDLDMSADGYVVAIGVPEHDGSRGQVRVYEYNEHKEDWVMLGSGIDGANEGDRASSVSLNAAGDMVAVGARGFDVGGEERVGHARVFAFDKYYGEWKQVGPDIVGDRARDNAVSLALDACGKQVAFGLGGFDVVNPDGSEINMVGAIRVYELTEMPEEETGKKGKTSKSASKGKKSKSHKCSFGFGKKDSKSRANKDTKSFANKDKSFGKKGNKSS